MTAPNPCNRFYEPGEDDTIVVVFYANMRLCLDVAAPGDKSPRSVIESAIAYLQAALDAHSDSPVGDAELADLLSLKIEEIDRYDLDTNERPPALAQLAREAP